MKRPDRTVRGQALSEFALVAPILILLFFGLTLSAFYAFRAAAADWGVFITGVAQGAYKQPSTNQARETVAWPDIAAGLQAAFLGNETRQVRSEIAIDSDWAWVYGIKLKETQHGSAYFRLWRFYPGPPDGGIE